MTDAFEKAQLYVTLTFYCIAPPLPPYLPTSVRYFQVYYTAIVADLVLRFNWLYSLIPPGHNPLPFLHSDTLPVFVTTVVIVCELLRRTMWGFFRLENEQIYNTEVISVSDLKWIELGWRGNGGVRVCTGLHGDREVFSPARVETLDLR